MDQKADFVPVLLGADGSAYGMARSFYEGYGVVSQALSTRVYPICQNSDIVKAAEVPQLDQDAEFVHTLRSFSERSDNVGKTLLLVPTEHRFARLLRLSWLNSWKRRTGSTRCAKSTTCRSRRSC